MNIAVIFAGGAGVRMNTKSRPKQFLELNGKPIIIYTLELFDNHPQIDAIVVACLKEWIPFLKKMLKKFEINKVVSVVEAGIRDKHLSTTASKQRNFSPASKIRRRQSRPSC